MTTIRLSDADAVVFRSGISYAQIVHYLGMASTTALLYDYMLSLSKEIMFVWSSPISLANALYYLVRYLPLPWAVLHAYFMVTPIRGSFCLVYIPGLLLAQSLTYVAATLLLCMRVLTLYPSRKWLSALVYGSLIVTHIAIIAVGVYGLVGDRDVYLHGSSYSDTIASVPITGNSCGLETPRLLGVSLLLLLPLEILIICLQLNHGLHHRYLTRGTSIVTTPLLQVFYRDGTVYFAFIFVVRLVTGILLARRLWPFYLLTFIEYSLTSIAVSHLFIHLRLAVRRQDEDNGEISTQEQVMISGMFRRSEELSLAGTSPRHHIKLTNTEHWTK